MGEEGSHLHPGPLPLWFSLSSACLQQSPDPNPPTQGPLKPGGHSTEVGSSSSSHFSDEEAKLRKGNSIPRATHQFSDTVGVRARVTVLTHHWSFPLPLGAFSRARTDFLCLSDHQEVSLTSPCTCSSGLGFWGSSLLLSPYSAFLSVLPLSPP